MGDPIRHRSRPVPPADPAAESPPLPSDERHDDPAPPSGDQGYDVGYGKPPQHSRFKAGVSGNPRGRPKGSRSIPILIERELDQRVTVRENGKPVRIRKRDLMVKQLVKQAAEGSHRALVQILKIDAERLQNVETSFAELGDDASTPERDREIIAQFQALFGNGAASTDGNDPSAVP